MNLRLFLRAMALAGGCALPLQAGVLTFTIAETGTNQITVTAYGALTESSLWTYDNVYDNSTTGFSSGIDPAQPSLVLKDGSGFRSDFLSTVAPVITSGFGSGSALSGFSRHRRRANCRVYGSGWSVVAVSTSHCRWFLAGNPLHLWRYHQLDGSLHGPLCQLCLTRIGGRNLPVLCFRQWFFHRHNHGQHLRRRLRCARHRYISRWTRAGLRWTPTAPAPDSGRTTTLRLQGNTVHIRQTTSPRPGEFFAL